MSLGTGSIALVVLGGGVIFGNASGEGDQFLGHVSIGTK